MSSIPTLPGIRSEYIQTARLRIHTLQSGSPSGIPVVFVHGNASSATFWEEVMLALPEQYWAIAPDLRGYGDTEDVLIDATRGTADFADDICSLVDALKIERYHVAGHSLGGQVLFTLIPQDAQRIISATLVAPSSPYGFGGTKGLDGVPCSPDFAGSGGGTVNPEFARLLGDGDRSSDHQASPRNVLNAFYWKPPFVPTREEDLLSSVLSEKVGDTKYPGDFVASEHWPNVAPGKFGPINAISAKYAVGVAERFVATKPKPPILWVRGADDQIVSDSSLFDFGMLGAIGAVPGWPGNDVFPPQPMVGQTRAVLEQYVAQGGSFREEVYADTGHSPFVEQPALFLEHFLAQLGR
jgi:pimeloyl-ACP methyl ester carboxylesterase